jgi:putative inorganic carbon (hco3(-)) transporter
MIIGFSYSNRATFRFGRGWGVVMLLVAFWTWATLLAFGADNQDAAWAFIDLLTKIVLPFLIGIATIDSVAKLKQLAWVILISQGYVAFEMNLSYFQGYNVLRIRGFAGLDNNGAAITLVTALGLAFFLGLNASKLWQKGVAFGMGALMVHAVLFSFSRGGMLAMILTGGVAFCLIPKRPKHYVAFCIAVGMTVYLAGPEVRERFISSFQQKDGMYEASAQSRVDLWKDCLDVMKKHPVMGVGPNHWPLIAPTYGWPKGKEAHSLWLQMGAELGFTGVGLLLSFYLLGMAQLWRMTRTSELLDDPWYPDCARMVIASLFGFIVSAQFVTVEGVEIPYYIALLGAGTLKLSSLPATVSAEEWDEEPDGIVETTIQPAIELNHPCPISSV